MEQPTVKVKVNLKEEDIALLDQVATVTGLSRSDVIRHALGLDPLRQEAPPPEGETP